MEDNTIPERLQDICREFALLARKHELKGFSLTFQPEYSEWGGKINCRWDWGRHGDDSNRLHISSDIVVNTQVVMPLK